ncbi:hypothetical protein C1634_025660 [Chryseobacterium viscerum]|uniref:Uncharacterized protein n=1 Tax=Chryseobacterium viscerum TaxID=1037377 RepID=A0A316W9B3_9FLAO|nr:hypothetical protein C1634_025660 [Chryseobacterium viscerum]
MKKKFLIGIMSLTGCFVLAQVGINTQVPQSTLDVVAKTTDGSKPEGVIAPRLTGDQIKAGDSQYGISQIGSILYATSAVGISSAKTVNITKSGYYYYDGSVWQYMGPSVSASASFQSIRGNVTTVSSGSYTVDASDFIIVTNHSAVVSITFPSLSNSASDIGRVVHVFNNNTGAFAVTYSGSYTAGNSATNQGRGRTFVWTGTTWANIGI